MALVLRASARHLLRHPWQLGLGLLGILLGVAVVCAVQLTQASARQALAYAQRAVLGDATHRIERPGGTLPETLYRDLALALPAVAMSPIVSGAIALAADPQSSSGLTLVGVDPLAQLDRAQAARRLGAGFDVARLMAEPGAAVVDARTARRLGLEPGAPLAVAAAGERAVLTLIAVAPPATASGGLAENIVVVDIATAQEVLHRPGQLSRIELVLAGDAERTVLERALPPGTELVATGAALEATRALTRAFDTNLGALSLLALLVGVFLAYNTQSFLVLQRYPVFSRLRALGVTRRELLGVLALEALALGALGSLLGAAAGIALAEVLLERVAATINDFYYRAAISDVTIAPGVIAGAMAAGMLATLAAALAPAWHATRVPVVNSLTRLRGEAAAGTRHPLARRLIGAGGLALALVLAVLPSQRLELGFAALFVFLLGGAALVPDVLGWLAARVAGAHDAARWPERVGAGTVARLDRRSGLAAAALAVAAAAGIGIGVMTASFRAAVADWLHTLLRADVYVSSPQGPAALAQVPALARALPQVDAVSTVRRLEVGSEYGPAALYAYELPPAAREGFQFLAGPWPGWGERWREADWLLVTEPYAKRHGVTLGASLLLDTPGGRVAFRVAGVYRDYASEQGTLAMSREAVARHWSLEGYDGIGLYARDGAAAGALAAALRRAMPAEASLELRSNAEIRSRSLAVFDRTFAVTEILRVLAVAVAVAGVLSALLAQQLERARDYGLLRAIGASRAEITRTVLAQTALVGVCAALTAVPLGLGLAVLLIEVINERSFGWSMALHVPWVTVAGGGLLVVAAALAAGVYPARRAARLAPARVLHDE